MHTPGPWTSGRPIPADDTVSRIVRAGDDHIAVVMDLEDAAQEAVDNARLIAAAPALLEALQAAIPALVRLGDFVGNFDKGGPSGQGHIDRCAIIMQAKRAIERATSGA